MVSWGLEAERAPCTRGLRRRLLISSGSESSCASIWLWRGWKKPGALTDGDRLPSSSTRGGRGRGEGSEHKTCWGFNGTKRGRRGSQGVAWGDWM